MSAPGPRIVVLGKALADPAMAIARDAGAEIFLSNAYLNGAELNSFLKESNPDAIVLRLGKVDADAMDAAPNLKIIAKHGVGYDTIDLAAADSRGVTVSIAAGANAVSVAEQALALMLAAARGIARLDARVRQGFWDKADYLGTELSGKMLGIVGVGAIGHHLARICRGLGMEILVYDPAIAAGAPSEYPSVESLEELLGAADVVSLHCPLLPSTRNMISTERLALMKPRSILVNTARGGLVDLEAVVTALEEGRIGGVGLDTFPEEPPVLSERLVAQQNIVVSPHVGASTIEAGQRVGTMAMQQVLDCIAGKGVDARYVVNKPAATEKAG